MLRAVLFDLDGVLVNACDLHFEALNRALEPYGCPIPHEEHLAGFNGLPTAVKLKRLSEEGKLPLDAHEPVHQAKQKYTIELIEDRIEPDSTKVELLEILRLSGLKIGVCSNAITESVGRMLKAVGVERLPHLVLGNEAVSNNKPHPDIYWAACQRLGLQPYESTIVEDSPIGLQAAEAAGPRSVIAVSGPQEVNVTLLNRILDEPQELRRAA